MKTKTFDCVEMKRRGALRVQEALQGLTPEQQVSYWKLQEEALLKRQKSLKKKTKGPPRP